MTLKEAKKMLEKEGWCSFQTLSYRPKGLPKDDWEKPEVYEALEVCWDNHIMPLIKKEAFDERKERLERGFYTDETTQTKIGGIKDYEKVNKIVDELIEECEKKKNKVVITSKPIDLAKEAKHLSETEEAFNDSMLDEQAKIIKGLEKKNKKLNDIIASRNAEILELQEKVKKMSKMGKQIAHLNEVIGKKNAQIKDYKIACEEHDWQLKDYMLSDKNKSDMISGLKKVNEGLRHKLAEATISKVNEQALKSAESALVYKDTVIDKLKEELGKRSKKIEKLSWKLEATEKARKEYCAYGVGANNFIKKICSAYVEAHDKKTFDIELYFESRHGMYGISPKTAFEYAKEEKARNKKKIFTGVDLGSEEGDKTGYVIDVCMQQKKLAEYVSELMGEIPKWVNFYSEWKEAEDSINDMSPEEFDKLFNKMFQNKFVW